MSPVDPSSPENGTVADGLAALVADLRAALEHAKLRGVWAEDPVSVVLPEPEPADTPLPAPPEPPSAPVVPVAAGQWTALAATARREAEERMEVGSQALRLIREDLGECRRCNLCTGRSHVVFGAGSPEADLVVVGEAPGYHEDRQGEPFVGQAGQMLDKMLENVLGLPRAEVYICNIVKCRPPQNRNPLPDEVDACLPFLQRQIAALEPKVLLVLGTVAFKTLFATSQGIMRSRGIWREYSGIPAMPTLHPAYLLRQPQDKRKAFEDLQAVRARYDELGGRRSS
ncbi:MAG: uracil-DNA glycosylase [Deltaproteobacteria bacterium]|nr:uracil-DNA glycosylase [Deltaproteobacteria bacterium]